MKNETRFETRLSKWIAGMYWGILVFLVVLLVTMPLVTTMSYYELLAFVGLFICILVLFVFILFRAYTMQYIVTADKVVIRGLFRTRDIPLSTLESVRKVPIPFGFRLLGSSFLGGWYYLPGIGRAWVAMTNFEDGVLLTTKKGKHFVVTPEKPQDFIGKVEKRS